MNAAFGVGFFPPLSIAAANMALALFLVLWVVRSRRDGSGISPFSTPLDRFILAFFGAWFLSSLFGTDVSRSLERFPSQIRFLVFYLLLWSAGGAAAFRGYLWGAGVLTVYGYLQWLLSTSGMMDSPPAWLARIDAAPRHYLSLKSGRVHGAVHPLTFAALILPAFFYGAASILEAADRKTLIKTMAATAFIGGALVLSQSRGPWLAAGVGFLFLLACHPRRARLVGPLLLAVAVFSLHSGFRARLSTLTADRRDDSAKHRLILWNNAWETFKRYPVLGVGPRNLAAAVAARGAEPGYRPNPWGMDGDAHNQYLQYAAERGAVGLAAFLALLAVFVFGGMRLLFKEGRRTPLVWGATAFFTAFPVVCLTERAFDDAEVALVLWVMAAALFSPPKRKKD